ncbi:MAG TPA: hypothetical protein DCS07_00145 [Bdellovibrionales bacterium]|nr:hypothetical protein [Bdellovibrionales bacterium]
MCWLELETSDALVALSEFFLIMEFISSMEEEVSSSEEACSVAAWESCSDEAAICCAALVT